MVVVATVGNLVVIWIVLAHKRMRTVTNYFIVNLSFADAMVSTLNTTLNFVYMLNSNWPFGTLFCKISQFVASLSICASVFTLMAIAIDRYMAIMNPLKPRMGKRATLCIAVSIWLGNDNVRVVCYAEWPDGATNHSLQEYVYNVVFMFLTYFLPIGSMTYTYARVGLELWGSQSIGECTQRQLDNIKSCAYDDDRSNNFRCLLGTAEYLFPANIILPKHNNDRVYPRNLFRHLLAGNEFRRGFKQFFRCCPFVHVGPEVLTRREVVTSRYSCSGSPDHHRIVRNDTERSFLYSCSGSPKSHRKSHGSVRIPLQMTKCNHGTNSTYITMNSFNNNNLTVPNVNEETNITTDNLLLQSSTSPNTTQHWTKNLNGNSQRSSSAS
ncbi:CLUMA_CG008386, isoform A [Clunio marinus]|uniref:CLUMA_CG008386, isoform A n=1 Tax=Clunio marinus TaxID=568069 RepID=A0A1J1I7G5_9DIPT|nr:CLUMA_CG008386, isoform A [Clunio marinus]